MEQVNEAQPQSQPPSQRFYALEQLGELAGTITLISEGLQAYRAQVAGLLAGQKKAEAFELYRLLERQRTYLVEQIRATRPFLMELENPLAPAAQKLAEQLAAFPLMTADYSKLTEVLKRFADALPDHQTTDASIIGRLMNNVRLGHYPTDLTHVGYIANSIVFPAENTANLIDPCCGTGDALLRLALGTDSQCYGIELDDHRAEQAQQQLYRVGFGSFFGSNISPGAFHAVFLNPPYLSVLSENGGRSRDEKRFLIESIPLLMMGGLLIYIVPYDTPYPHFPIPRLVFGFSLNQEGKASHCRIGVVADEIPTPETPMYYYPFSNVSRESGSLCVGANTLPIYKKPHKAHNLPAFLLSIPNNMHYYSSSNNKLGLEYRELMEHLKDKDPEYYYSDILIPKKETLGEFIQRA